MPKTFESLEDVYRFLEKLGASARLLRHVKLVDEAAEILIEKLRELNIPVDKDFVRLGVAFHDAGKIIHTAELSSTGNSHEAAGEKLLLENKIAPNLARCCRSHGQWQTMDCSFEEFLIALSDKLWKGKRENKLEEIVIDKIAQLSGRDRWEIFVEMDSCFEKIALKGDERLLRSREI